MAVIGALNKSKTLSVDVQFGNLSKQFAFSPHLTVTTLQWTKSRAYISNMSLFCLLFGILSKWDNTNQYEFHLRTGIQEFPFCNNNIIWQPYFSELKQWLFSSCEHRYKSNQWKVLGKNPWSWWTAGRCTHFKKEELQAWLWCRETLWIQKLSARVNPHDDEHKSQRTS